MKSSPQPLQEGDLELQTGSGSSSPVLVVVYPPIRTVELF